MSSTDRRRALPPSLLESTAAMMRADFDAFHDALAEAGLIAPPPPRFGISGGVLTARNASAEAALTQMTEEKKARMVTSMTTYSATPTESVDVDLSTFDLPMPDPAPVPGGLDEEKWESLIDALALARHARNRARHPLTPPEVAKAVVTGLRRWGVKAEPGKVFEGGKFARSRPMLIQFPCLSWHRTEDRSDFETVRLIVEEHPHEDMDVRGLLDPFDPSCEACGDVDWNAWLTTPDPSRLDDEGDALAPADNISEVLRDIELQATATWWRDYPEEAQAAERARWGARVPSRFRVPDGEQTRSLTAEEFLTWRRSWWLDKIRPARTTATGTAGGTGARSVEWTVETAARWLDGLTDEGGVPLVPVTLGLRKVWSLVKDIEPHPPRAVVWEAQERRQG